MPWARDSRRTGGRSAAAITAAAARRRGGSRTSAVAASAPTSAMIARWGDSASAAPHPTAVVTVINSGTGARHCPLAAVAPLEGMPDLPRNQRSDGEQKEHERPKDERDLYSRWHGAREYDAR